MSAGEQERRQRCGSDGSANSTASTRSAATSPNTSPPPLGPLERDQRDHPDWFYNEPLTVKGLLTLRYPYQSFCHYLRRLNGNFTPQFVALLFSGYFGIKGSLFSFLTAGLLPYFKSYLHVTGAQYQDYSTIALSPWGMKAIFGTVSDLLPIGGYHKRYYLVIAGVSSATCFTVLAAADLTPAFAPLAALLFAAAATGVVIVDLLLEGQYVPTIADMRAAAA